MVIETSLLNKKLLRVQIGQKGGDLMKYHQTKIKITKTFKLLSNQLYKFLY